MHHQDALYFNFHFVTWSPAALNFVVSTLSILNSLVAITHVFYVILLFSYVKEEPRWRERELIVLEASRIVEFGYKYACSQRFESFTA